MSGAIGLAGNKKINLAPSNYELPRERFSNKGAAQIKRHLVCAAGSLLIPSSENLKYVVESTVKEKKNGAKVKLIFDKLSIDRVLFDWNELKNSRFKITNKQNGRCRGDPLSLKMVIYKCRSVVNKITELEALLLTHDPHIAILSETWLHDIYDSEFVPTGYSVYRKDRVVKGEGLPWYIKTNWK